MRKIVKVLFGLALVSLVLGVLVWPLPIERVLAEGEGEAPEVLTLLAELEISNMTFQVVNTELNLTVNDSHLWLGLESASVTIWTCQTLPNATETRIYLDVQGADVQTDSFHVSLDKLLLEMHFTTFGNQTMFRVVATAYVPTYRLIQTLLGL